MTDNLIGPKPDGPTYPTPWQADFDRVLDADDASVFYLGHDDQPLLIGIVDAVNAYYGGEGGLNYLREVLDAKDARIADLERKLKRANDTMADLRQDADNAEQRADDADKDAEELNKLLTAAEKRAEAAEVQLEDAYSFQWKILNRAEKAEARVRDLEFQLEGATESLEEARGRVGELERKYYLTARSVGLGWQIKADRDTFTAPDGRVFRVGQRVYGVLSKAHLGKVTGWNTKSGTVYYDGGYGAACYDNLRRVWDGSEEPDVPVGTVLRDDCGCRIEKTADREWLLDDGLDDGLEEWGWPDDSAGPYVEVLEGDA